MASLSYVEREISALPQNLRPIFLRIFTSILRDLRIGHPDHLARTENMAGAFYQAKTPPIADTLFTVPHEFGRIPYLAYPVLPLDKVGAEIVPLQVAQVADDKRLYFKSSETNAEFFIAVEG